MGGEACWSLLWGWIGVDRGVETLWEGCVGCG